MKTHGIYTELGWCRIADGDFLVIHIIIRHGPAIVHEDNWAFGFDVSFEEICETLDGHYMTDGHSYQPATYLQVLHSVGLNIVQWTGRDQELSRHS